MKEKQSMSGVRNSAREACKGAGWPGVQKGLKKCSTVRLVFKTFIQNGHMSSKTVIQKPFVQNGH